MDICVDNPAVQSSHDHEDFITLERRGQVESIRQHCIVILVRSQKIFKSAKKWNAKEETEEDKETKEKFETQEGIKKEKDQEAIINSGNTATAVAEQLQSAKHCW